MTDLTPAQSEAVRFINDSFVDETLSGKFESVIGDKSFDEVAENVVQLAIDNGYDLTMDALKEVRELAFAGAKEMEEGDLSDDDLENVSGGVLGWAINQTELIWSGDRSNNPKKHQFWTIF